jgi:hypothetical protein
MGVYQKLSWQDKTEYQLYLGLEAMEHALAEVYYAYPENDHAAYHRLMHVTLAQVFEHVAGFPCPSHLHQSEAIGNQDFHNSTEKTAFVIAECWKRARYAVNGRMISVRGLMKLCNDLIHEFVDSFKFGQRTRDKEGKLAQLKLDCQLIVSSLPADTMETIKAMGEE